jgi:hypothetical protein
MGFPPVYFFEVAAIFLPLVPRGKQEVTRA